MKNLCARMSFVQWLAIAVAIVAAASHHKAEAGDPAQIQVPVVVLGMPLA